MFVDPDSAPTTRHFYPNPFASTTPEKPFHAIDSLSYHYSEKVVQRFLIIVSIVFSLSPVRGQSDFESGLSTPSIMLSGPGMNLIRVQASPFLNMRVTNCHKKLLWIEADDRETGIFSPDHRLVWRYENEDTWRFMDSTSYQHRIYGSGNIRPFDHDTIRVAYWLPYSPADHGSMITDIASLLPGMTSGFAGYTQKGNPIPWFKIRTGVNTTADPVKVLLLARQHADESPASFALEGFVKYLLNTSSQIQPVPVEFLVIPLVNPDEVMSGSPLPGKKDINSLWFSSGDHRQPGHENQLIAELIAKEFGGSAGFLFDFHAEAGSKGPYYFWGIKSSPADQTNNISQSLVEEAAAHFADHHNGMKLISPDIRRDVYAFPGPWADYWAYENLGAIPFTFEITSCPSANDPDLYRAAGASVAAGFLKILPTFLDTTGNNFRIASKELKLKELSGSTGIKGKNGPGN